MVGQKCLFKEASFFSDTTEEGTKECPSTMAKNKSDEPKKSAPVSTNQLAQSAKKKNVRNDDQHFEFKTRKAAIMKPENQRLKKFNLVNFRKVETRLELQFMLQELH